MAVDSVLVRCGSCRAQFEEDPHAPAEERRSCPNCGSRARHFDVNVSDTVTLHSKLRARGRHSGKGRPFIDQSVGNDLDRRSGHWMKLHRLIDRMKNWYHERVTDPATGKIVHECDESLSDHKGHGSARNPPPDKDAT